MYLEIILRSDGDFYFVKFTDVAYIPELMLIIFRMMHARENILI